MKMLVCDLELQHGLARKAQGKIALQKLTKIMIS